MDRARLPTLKPLIYLTAAVVLGEILIQLILRPHLPSAGDRYLEILVETGVLLAILVPALYLFVYRRILTNNMVLRRAQRRLKSVHADLEQRVDSRTRELAESNERLEEFNGRLTKHKHGMTLLRDLSHFMLACDSLQEAYGVIGTLLPKIFPQESGAVFVMSASRNVMEKQVSWGAGDKLEGRIAPSECWALRRGKPHEVGGPRDMIRCSHTPTGTAGPHVCLPMTVHGEALGILYLEGTSINQAPGAGQDQSLLFDLREAVAENLALGIANLRLQETLEFQAVRDPLTRLFNRRHFIEKLNEELERSVEEEVPVSVAMFDLDHFKKFNDANGHDAGDTVLIELAKLLQNSMREEDVACRYGGEEFAILFGNTDPDTAHARMEEIRAAVAEMTVTHQGHSLGRVTISGGVAGCPQHGTDKKSLLFLADEALYRSKDAGRNRITLAANRRGTAAGAGQTLLDEAA